ncbi:MAG: polysaccharide biosynthesis tyrosine autokinase [Bacteroidales bacterium]
MQNDNNNTPLFQQNQEEFDSLDLTIRLLVYKVVANWYWFLLSLVVVMGLGYYYINTRANLYETQTSVLLRQERSSPEEMLLFQDLGYHIGKTNIDNEIGLFKSPDMIERVVSSYELHTTYFMQGKFGKFTREIYNSSPLYVRVEDVEPNKIPYTTTLLFEPKKNGSLALEATHIEDRDKITTKRIVERLPAIVELPSGKFYIAEQEGNGALKEPLTVIVRNATQVARATSRQIEISTTTKQSSVLSLRYKSRNPQKGKDFSTALIAEYNRDAIADKNTIAYNTSVFVDERLKYISAELELDEKREEEFRKEHKITKMDTQADLFIKRGEGYESRRMEIETQQNLVRYIEEFIANSNNRQKLIPNLGLKEPGLVGLIQEYNTLLLQKDRVEGATSSKNPVLQQLNAQVANLHQQIALSIENEKEASAIALKDLEREYTIVNSQIRNIPTVERQYADIVRQREIKNELYIFLLQKREEVNITQSAVAPKAKIISQPHAPRKPVEPKKELLYLAFLIAAVVIPSAVLYLKELFRTRIDGTADLEKLQQTKVVGDIVRSEDAIRSKSSLVVHNNDSTMIGEMFRTLRNNLLFMANRQEGGSIVLVTSTVPKEGKTFISANLAKSLSLMDKRVLLVGADLRNPQISHSLGIAKSTLGFSSYLAGHIEDYHQLIEEMEPNFFVMQSGPIPPNPNELLSREKSIQLLQELRNQFHYIILDSAPVGVVSDSYLLGEVADATLYVMRDRYSYKDTIPFLNTLLADKRLHNVGVVLNYATPQTSIGRYKYSYKYKYRYKYGYGYNYKTNE